MVDRFLLKLNPIKKHPEPQVRGVSLSKKQHFNSCALCGSTHKIEFAQQIHNSRGRVPRELYKGRKIVPVRARLFVVRIRLKAWFQSRGCSKNRVFRQPQHPEPQVRGVFYSEQRLKSDISFSILHFQFSITLSRPAGYKSHAQWVRARPADFRTRPWDCPAD